MDWDFLERNLAGDVNAASQSRIILESDHSISQLEVFVREVLQNSLDAAVRESGQNRKVTVDFTLHALSEQSARMAVLNTMGWRDLKQHIEASNSYFRTRKEPPAFSDPVALERSSLKILEIRETNTIGLVGPERLKHLSDEAAGELPKAYIALCRDDARREKQSLGSGGMYGLGKGALWAASEIQLVLFFSRLYLPWQTDKQLTTHRAAGQVRLSTHYVGNNAYRGLGFGGEKREDWAQPLRNGAAQEFARKLGIDQRREENAFGTTILIPFWSQPECDAADANMSISALLTKYAARFFWPAIIEDRLEVTASENAKSVNAREHLLHYTPFVELYRRTSAGEKSEADAESEDIPLVIPPGPPPLNEPETRTFVRCAFSQIESTDVQEDLISKVACIRGQGMVIGYQRMTGSAPVQPFVGLALGGRIVDKRPQGVRGDMLLGYSEYVTHTRWDEKSTSLRLWPKARPRVREALNRIQDYFLRHSAVHVPAATGDLTPLQELLKIPGIGRGPVPKPIPGGIPVLRRTRFEREDNHYAFELKANVEKGASQMNVDVWVDAGIEGGSPSRRDRFDILDIKTVPAALSAVQLANNKVRIEVPSFPTETQVTIKGQTEDLDPRVLAVSEARLRATISRVTATEPKEAQELEESDAQG